MTAARAFLVRCLALALASCGDDAAPVDAGPTDAGRDAGSDAGALDADRPDSASTDAGSDDAALLDAGRPDSGPTDAGSDGGSDDGAIVPCTTARFPATGDACDPDELSPRQVCRRFYCASHCYPECTCRDRHWECLDQCRDFAIPDAGRPYCGRAPLCWDFWSCITWADGAPLPCYEDVDCAAGERCEGADAGPRDVGQCLPR